MVAKVQINGFWAKYLYCNYEEKATPWLHCEEAIRRPAHRRGDLVLMRTPIHHIQWLKLWPREVKIIYPGTYWSTIRASNVPWSWLERVCCNQIKSKPYLVPLRKRREQKCNFRATQMTIYILRHLWYKVRRMHNNNKKLCECERKKKNVAIKLNIIADRRSSTDYSIILDTVWRHRTSDLVIMSLQLYAERRGHFSNRSVIFFSFSYILITAN